MSDAVLDKPESQLDERYIRPRCGAKHSDPEVNVRCDLVEGHSGPHQWGGTQIWLEWEDDDGD